MSLDVAVFSLFVTCLCLSFFVPVCRCLSLFVVCHVSLFVSVCLFLSLFVSVCLCVSLFVSVCLFLSLFVSVCLQVSLCVAVCLCVSARKHTSTHNLYLRTSHPCWRRRRVVRFFDHCAAAHCTVAAVRHSRATVHHYVCCDGDSRARLPLSPALLCFQQARPG